MSMHAGSRALSRIAGAWISLRGSGAGLRENTGAPCTRGEADVWTCNLDRAEGEVTFKAWIDDSIDARGTPWQVTAPSDIDIYPFFFETEGDYEILEDFSSTILGNTRDVAVYLPPSYDENTAKHYPIRSYRVDEQAPGFLGGTSLAGLVAIYGAWTRPQEFAGVAALSPSLWWDDQVVVDQIEADENGPEALRIYLDSGSSEGAGTTGPVAALKQVLLAKGWMQGQDLLHVSAQGHQHNETWWKLRIPAALTFLLRDPFRVQP
ncbi:MAG TPA: alpha/beta hydrolase-fold protein [Candidatus Binatia bacterium]|nr:alpha/beta hydrolase-fold protein [Candidatus Binatia bacterium]